MADPVLAAAETLAADCDADAFTAAEQALDAGPVDAVYICVPPFAHGEPERAALARGLPIFVEKPVAVDEATALALAAEVRDAGVVTATGYHWRCLDLVDVARRELATRPALLAHGVWLGGRPPVAWWGDPARSGGQVVEQLTHVLDLVRVLLGEVVEVAGAGAQLAGAPSSGSGDRRVDDATTAVLRLESGGVATVSATSLLTGLHRASLQTFSAGLTMELSQDELVVDRGLGRRTVRAPVEDPRVVVDRDFLAAVRGEQETTAAPYDEAVRSHLLACAISRSAREGNAVRPEVWS